MNIVALHDFAAAMTWKGAMLIIGGAAIFATVMEITASDSEQRSVISIIVYTIFIAIMLLALLTFISIAYQHVAHQKYSFIEMTSSAAVVAWVFLTSIFLLQVWLKDIPFHYAYIFLCVVGSIAFGALIATAAAIARRIYSVIP